MAINILDFDAALHKKVRFNNQLYAVLLREDEFTALSPETEVVIHFMSHDKIFVRASLLGQVNFVVAKEQLTPVEAHIIE